MSGTKYPCPHKVKAASVPKRHMHPGCETLMMVGGRGQYEDQYVTATKQSCAALQGPKLTLIVPIPCRQLLCPPGLPAGWKAGLHDKICRAAEQTTPLVMARIPQLSYPNYCFWHVLAGFWLGFYSLPSKATKKKKSRFFGMVKANTNKHFAGCSGPLLKYIGCTSITYSPLSDVIVSLVALLGLWHFVTQAS